MREANRVLKRTEEYLNNRSLGEEDYVMMYILARREKMITEDVIAFAGSNESVILFHPYKNDDTVSLWEFDYTRDLFDELEDGYELIGMTLECHYSVWCYLEEEFDYNMRLSEGNQEYLSYCKKNRITKELLQELKYSGMNVMSLYEPKAAPAKRHKEYER